MGEARRLIDKYIYICVCVRVVEEGCGCNDHFAKYETSHRRWGE